MYFRYFVIISPWKRTEPFIWIIFPLPKDDDNDDGHRTNLWSEKLTSLRLRWAKKLPHHFCFWYLSHKGILFHYKIHKKTTTYYYVNSLFEKLYDPPVHTCRSVYIIGLRKLVRLMVIKQGKYNNLVSKIPFIFLSGSV